MILKGNSGCNLRIEGDTVIKSATGSYSPRLLAQAKKQMAAEDYMWCGIYLVQGVPITNIKDDSNGSVEIEMPLIKGMTVAEAVYENKNAMSLVRALGEFVKKNITFSHPMNTKAIFLAKFADMKNKTPALTDELEWFERTYLDELLKCPAGYCHGDFTLENIIFNSERRGRIKYNNLHLIDFLDSFIDTPLMDAATVLQDLMCKWSYRYKALDEKQEELLKILTREFMNKLDDYKLQILALLLLKIYRIVPYVKDKVTEDWCNVNIKFIKEMLEEVKKC